MELAQLNILREDECCLSELAPINVVIFGETGTGKSATINMIVDKSVVISDDSVKGTTEKSQVIEHTPLEYPYLRLHLFDTAGLGESSEGKVPADQAFIQLVKTVYQLPAGINLLICCHKKSRLSTEVFKRNYRVFVEEVCEKKVPCILLITHGDFEKPMGTWWEKNKSEIAGLGFQFIDGVTVTTEKEDKNGSSDDFYLSRKRLIEAIDRYRLQKPWKMDSVARTVAVFWRRTYNRIAQATQSFPKLFVLHPIALRKDLFTLFQELKFDPDTAVKQANELFEEIQKIANDKGVQNNCSTLEPKEIL